MNPRLTALLGAATLAVLLASPGRGLAQTAEPPFIVGVSGHLLHTGDRSGQANRLMRDAGVASVRDDAHWAFVERSRDRLRIEPSWYRYLRENERHALKSMLILGYGNLFHGKGEKPRDEPTRAAFARYVDFVTARLKGRVEFYEVWNEWDVEDPKDPDFTRDYARLIELSAQRIRQQDPSARVLAGAVTSRGIKSGFAHRLIENGILDSVDGLSLHPYVHCRGRQERTPEAWIAWMREVDASLTRAAGRPVPLYLTEMSWPAHDGPCGIDEDLQAAYLARSYFLARTLPNIKGMWWYDIRNDGLDRHEREHNFGLLDHDFRPKPAYRTLLAISEILRDYRFETALRAGHEDAVLLRFSRNGQQVLVGWSQGERHSITLGAPSSGHRLQLIDTARPQLGRFDADTGWRCLEDDRHCSILVALDEFPKVIFLNGTDAFSEPFVLASDHTPTR